MSHPDDRFHPAPDDDPFWTETCWFTFAVPERKLSGQLYPFLRRNQGVTSSACFLWDDTGSELWDCLYAKNLWHVPLADDARLEALSLPSGLHYECLEDLKRYRLRYLDPDEKRVEIDLHFDALQPPNYLAESHLDQPGRYTGTIRIDDESVPVDAFGFRDRSWGSRSQIGDTLSNSGAPRGGYSYATASEGDGFHAITMAFEADACIPIHGYLVRDGEYAKLVPGKGGRDVLERAERDAPTRVRLRGEDELGRAFEAEGRCVNKIGVHLNPNLFTWNCLTEWEWDGGRGWGEDHDNWSAPAATRFFRALRAGR
ncbi:MAG: hypothetical protein AAF430_11685 [Myxococcota bacterium]